MSRPTAHSWRHRRHTTLAGPRLVMVVVLVAVLTSTFGLSGAQAYWSVSSFAAGSGAASLVTMNQAATPTVSFSKRALTPSWTAATLSDGTPVTGYTVSRYDTSNVAQTVLSGCAGTITTTSCTETAVPEGQYTYTVTPLYAGWTGPESARSVQVYSDGTAPVTSAITRNALSGGSYVNGSFTLYYRGVDAGSLTLTPSFNETGSGVASFTTGALGSGAAGWTHNPSTVSTPAGGPFVTNPYSWVAGTTGNPNSVLTATDRSGNTNGGRSVFFVNDSTAPSGATLTYPSGWDSGTGSYPSTALTLKLGTVTDSGSGITTANRSLQQRTATLSAGTCGTFTSWSEVATISTSTADRTLSNNTCYDYRYVVTDNVGNSVTVASPGVLKVQINYSGAVLATAGLVDYYRLGDQAGSTTAVDAQRTANNGTWSGGPTLGVAGAIKSDTDTAATFDGVDDYATIPRSISDDFSIEFWFRSTQGRGTSSTWTDGAALVDASVTGVASDFGTSLMQDGRVCAGTGNPDTTVCSSAGWADSAWHQVVVTRATNGDKHIALDGGGRVTAGGSSASLTAPASIRVGCLLQSASNCFNGSIDEVSLYTGVLSDAIITSHYQAGIA